MRRPSPTLIALIFFVILDTMAFYAAYVNSAAERNPVTLSAAAPEVAWKDFDGATHHLKDLMGHVVVLHFWASWCGPCREEFPQLLKAAEDNPDVMFLTVSSDTKQDPALLFIKRAPDLSGLKSPPNVLYAWDPHSTITYEQFLTSRFPESIFIDPTGHMRRKFPVPVDWSSKEIKDYLKELKGTK